jgi:hypothetical protein
MVTLFVGATEWGGEDVGRVLVDQMPNYLSRNDMERVQLCYWLRLADATYEKIRYVLVSTSPDFQGKVWKRPAFVSTGLGDQVAVSPETQWAHGGDPNDDRYFGAITGINPLAGIEDVKDGWYNLYVAFVDLLGYRSERYDFWLYLDQAPPGIKGVELLPDHPIVGEKVEATVGFSEPLDEARTVLRLVPSDGGPPGSLAFLPASRLGASWLYRFTMLVPQEAGGRTYVLEGTFTDEPGNAVEVTLVGKNGEALEVHVVE